MSKTRVFSYGKNEFLNNRITGSGYNFISLSADSNGKELTIKVYVATDNSISSFSSIELDESRNCTRNFIYNNLIYIFSSIFLVVFGIILLFIAIILSISSSRRFLPMVYVAVFSILVGLWFSCNRGYIILLSNNTSFNRIAEYFTLYCFPIPIMLFLVSIRKKDSDKTKKINWPMVIFLISTAMVVITVILHLLDLVLD